MKTNIIFKKKIELKTSNNFKCVFKHEDEIFFGPENSYNSDSVNPIDLIINFL
jgi:hypothetical protein